MNNRCFRILIFLLTGMPVIFSSAAVPADDAVEKYSVKRVTGTIKVDGILDENDWKRAKEAPMKDVNTGKDVPSKTTVRLLWDDDFFYVGFYGEDNDAWTTLMNRDDNLWEEEVFEIFIDPENKGHTYYEININPADNIVDLFVTNGGESRRGIFTSMKGWNFKEIKHGVFVEGDGIREGTRDRFWTAEIAIPFDELWIAPFTPPEDGDMWRMNFFRIERGKSDDPGDDWRASFSPTMGLGFHIPWRFGKIYFRK
ncbi:carbohydrate-binding family 9-like protein [Candidatus Latescibacterota bacterium]